MLLLSKETLVFRGLNPYLLKNTTNNLRVRKHLLRNGNNEKEYEQFSLVFLKKAFLL